MKKIKCYYTDLSIHDYVIRCTFVNEENQYIGSFEKVYEYLMHTLRSDIYYQSKIDECFSLISQAEANPKELYGGCGQQFCLDLQENQVIFYHNDFDEEDGFPVLSCLLHTFKTALIAWNAFLQLPKSILRWWKP